MRPIPALAVTFISKWEGVRLRSYLDSAGIPTIGVGHIAGVKMGQTITAEQSAAFLREDLQDAAGKIERKIGAVVNDLTDEQYSALLSFVFNVGSGNPAHKEWAIWGLLRAKAFDQVPGQLALYTKARDPKTKQLVKVAGLVNRRAAEQVLWATNEPGTTEAKFTSAVTRSVDTPPTPMVVQKKLALSKRLWLGFMGALAGAGQWMSDHLPGVGNMVHQLQALIAPQISYSAFLAKLSGGLAVIAVGAGAAVMLLQTKAHNEAKP